MYIDDSTRRYADNAKLFLPEYEIIRDYYGNRTAKRSGVKLINHIDEGLVVLYSIGASTLAAKAFCIHPIIQSGRTVDNAVVSPDVIKLAEEYRDKANAYLCCKATDYVQSTADVQKLVGSMSRNCADMLFADKVQNQKDFTAYHVKTHPRSAQLATYFDLWVMYLATTVEIVDPI